VPGGTLFEIVLVLLFVFITMSAIVSSAQELLFQALGWRSRKLRKTVEGMLSDKTYGKMIADRVFRHPMVSGAEGGRKRVSYIEPAAFVTALATAVQPRDSQGDPVDELPFSVAALKAGDLRQRLLLVVPPASAAPPREAIEKAASDWFDAAIRKNAQRYKADASAASYLIAAVATVALNVSPIEIAQRLTTDEALRTTFASAVPDLAPLLYNPGQGLPINTPAASSLSGDGSADLGVESAGGLEARLDPAQLATMLAVYQCAESKFSLPVGWPWMANAATFLDRNGASAALGLSEENACAAAADRALGVEDPEIAAGVQKLLSGDFARTGFEREYGPSFTTDSPLLIFLGWLIMVVAAGQGAPFWFNLLQRFVRR
jgi:hypothetical protein